MKLLFAAEACGLINFPTLNTAQIKALGKATNPVQQMMIASPGLHQSFWPLPVLWDAGDPPSLSCGTGGFGDSPSFPGIPGELPFSALQYPGTFLKKQKAAEGQGV